MANRFAEQIEHLAKPLGFDKSKLSLSPKGLSFALAKPLGLRLRAGGFAVKENSRESEDDLFSELQRDWSAFGPTCFDVTFLGSGPLYKNKATRKRFEKESIAEHVKREVDLYNTIAPKARSRNQRTEIEVDGMVYYSIKEASRRLNMAETTIRRRLKDSSTPNFKVLKQEEVGCSKISVDGVVYNSIVELIERGLVKNRQMATHRLKSGEERWKDWFYVLRASDVREARRASRSS